MTSVRPVRAQFWKESGGHCECCGRVSRKIWGELSDSEAAHAVYFVHWTVGAPEHYPNIDLVIGPWGSSSTPNDRILVSLIYRPASGGGSFMVIDGDGRPADDRGLCARAMKRGEVVGTPFATEVFSLVDALWLTEPRIDEVRQLDHEA